MNDTTRRRFSPATLFRILAVALALVLVCAVTLQRSQSAFSGQTKMGGATVGAGQVSLTNTATQGFDVLDAIPGDSVVRCVDVRYTGTVTGDRLSAVKLFTTDAGSTGLEDYLVVRADMGPVGSSCASNPTWTTSSSPGNLKSELTDHSTYATGQDTGWVPGANETRPFRLTATLPANTPNEAQGKAAKVAVTWEVRTVDGTRVR